MHTLNEKLSRNKHSPIQKIYRTVIHLSEYNEAQRSYLVCLKAELFAIITGQIPIVSSQQLTD